VRGIQLVVAITLATFAYLLYDGIHTQQARLDLAFATMKPGWLVVAAVLALQEGVFGGLRMYVLGRVLSKELRVRTAVISEFVLMFCAGVTPGQAGAAPSQVAVLVHGGMKFVDVATAALVTASCTILFFLVSAVTVFAFRASGWLVVEGAELDWLIGVSVAFFGSGLVGLLLCAAYPPLLKAIIRLGARALTPIAHLALRLLSRLRRARAWARATANHPGALEAKMLRGVDEVHEGFMVYADRGKLAYVVALLLTFGFFASRFAVAYFILLGLGIPTTPDTFVAIGPPIVQVVLVQALLNFALYLSPTPGASGIAEAGSATLMSPWVKGAYELPYLVLWRLLALFLCMFVGGIYVFRYLGTDVLEARVKEAEAAKLLLEQEQEAKANARDAAA
jgi:uncharacterized protein (TIRG00374 family)